MRIIVSIFIGMLSFNVAYAHHSNAASYIDETTTVEGVVDQYLFRNPHVVVYINVTDDAVRRFVGCLRVPQQPALD